MVPGAGIEPAWRHDPPRGFKPLVSTSFTTRAKAYKSKPSRLGATLCSYRDTSALTRGNWGKRVEDCQVDCSCDRHRHDRARVGLEHRAIRCPNKPSSTLRIFLPLEAFVEVGWTGNWNHSRALDRVAFFACKDSAFLAAIPFRSSDPSITSACESRGQRCCNCHRRVANPVAEEPLVNFSPRQPPRRETPSTNAAFSPFVPFPAPYFHCRKHTPITIVHMAY